MQTDICVAVSRTRHEARNHRAKKLFVGSEGGVKAAAIAYTLIETAKLNGVNPQAWLSHVFGTNADHKIMQLDELMPCRYAASAA